MFNFLKQLFKKEVPLSRDPIQLEIQETVSKEPEPAHIPPGARPVITAGKLDLSRIRAGQISGYYTPTPYERPTYEEEEGRRNDDDVVSTAVVLGVLESVSGSCDDSSSSSDWGSSDSSDSFSDFDGGDSGGGGASSDW
jgi:uncharacterized membrane protein YgcG